MTYSYCIKSHPFVDENLHTLISNPNTIGYDAKIGEQLNINEFFEVLDVDNNLVGYIWFVFYSDDFEIEINIGKSPVAHRFQGFAKQVLTDLDKFKIELPTEWFNEHSKWLSIVKDKNPHKVKLESLLISNGFEKDGEDGFLKEIK